MMAPSSLPQREIYHDSEEEYWRGQSHNVIFLYNPDPVFIISFVSHLNSGERERGKGRGKGREGEREREGERDRERGRGREGQGQGEREKGRGREVKGERERECMTVYQYMYLHIIQSCMTACNAESKITTPGKGLHSQNISLQYTESKLIHGLYTSVSLNVH